MKEDLTYEELLNLPEWKSKRKEIISRDKLTCQHCQNRKYYDQSLKGVFAGFFNANVPGTPIFNLGANYFLTKKLSEELHIEKNSLLFFKEKEEKLYIYAIRKLTKGEIKKYYDWIVKKLQDYGNNSEDKMDSFEFEKSPSETDWTYVRDMHVHHTYYQKGLLPWEYPNQSLQSLCWSCHAEVHETTDIPVKDELGDFIGYIDPCERCYGAGYIPMYKNIENGVCFSCRGKGYLSNNFIRKTKKYL